jgi:hypothetical protein
LKTLLRTIGWIVVCLVVFLVIVRFTGFAPTGRTPGLWLKGTVVTAPVSDWSFADKYPNVEIETRGVWLPHSVTTNCVTYDHRLYVDSIYRAGLVYPHGRSWNENVARDPHVRIKIGSQLYNCTLVHITDPAEIASVLDAKTKKYPDLKTPANGSVQIFQVVGG